eukprot:4990960-Prymnesium_polylepis.1
MVLYRVCTGMPHTTWTHNMGCPSSHNICPFIAYICAGICANTAWHACNEEVYGSPVRSAEFGGIWQYTGRPWMATERA